MDRLIFVNYLNSNWNHTEFNLKLVKDYCLEKGKKVEDTMLLIKILEQVPIIARYYVEIAKEYYMKKYAIITVSTIEYNQFNEPIKKILLYY